MTLWRGTTSALNGRTARVATQGTEPVEAGHRRELTNRPRPDASASSEAGGDAMLTSHASRSASHQCRPANFRQTCPGAERQVEQEWPALVGLPRPERVPETGWRRQVGPGQRVRGERARPYRLGERGPDRNEDVADRDRRFTLGLELAAELVDVLGAQRPELPVELARKEIHAHIHTYHWCSSRIPAEVRHTWNDGQGLAEPAT